MGLLFFRLFDLFSQLFDFLNLVFGFVLGFQNVKVQHTHHGQQQDDQDTTLQLSDEIEEELTAIQQNATRDKIG